MRIKFDFRELTDFASRLQSGARFEEAMGRTAKAVAKALLKQMKSLTPVDSYELINGWDSNKFAVIKKPNGCEVLIVNKTPYALYVNDGHKAYNQYGGPYQIKHRVQVRSPHQWQEGDQAWYVFGHFFVERGILRLTESKEIEAIIMRELTKWWEGCING